MSSLTSSTSQSLNLTVRIFNIIIILGNIEETNISAFLLYEVLDEALATLIACYFNMANDGFVAATDFDETEFPNFLFPVI
jgi:hypothetical protein